MGKVKGGILIAAGVLIAAVGVNMAISAPEKENKFSEAVYINDGKVRSENEGKLVVLTGTLEADLPFTDPATGIELPYLTAARNVERYERRTHEDDVIWEWNLINADYSEKGNYGINSPDLISATILAPTTIGEFTIAEELLMPLNRGKDFVDYDLDNVQQNGWNLLDGAYDKKYLSMKSDIPVEKTTEKDSISTYWQSEYAGMLRISYQIMDPDDPLVYTFIGVQKGNTLVKAKALDMTSTYQGEHTLDEFTEDISRSSKGGMLVSVVIALLLICFGVRSLRKS